MNGVNYASGGSGILSMTAYLLVIANTLMPLNYQCIKIFRCVSIYIYIYICMYIYIDRHRHGLLILLWLALQVSNLPIRAVVTFLLIKYLRLIHASTGMSMCTGTEPTILKLELGSLRKGHINVNFLLMHIHMISVN